jgi:hypothetical protein
VGYETRPELESGGPGGMKVDFIGIGVQRAATTWLFSCLKEHPEIRGATVANNKELNFFNHNYEKGYPWYHRRFEFGAWKTGEYSTRYFHDKNVPARIARYNPDARLIVSLRNPIDRAVSQHKLEIRRNRLPEHLVEFEKALPHNPSYIEQGRYATHLERWLRFFDRAQIHVILFDEIVSSPGQALGDLFSFLGVDASFRPVGLSKRVNVSHTYRSRRLHRLIRLTSAAIRGLFGPVALEAIKATGLPALVRGYNEVDLVIPPLSEEGRRRLLEVFRPEIERLEGLIGRDLSRWI